MKPKVASSELAGPYSDDQRSSKRSIMGLNDAEAEDLWTRGTGNVEERDEMRNALVRQYPMSRVSDGDRRERDFVDRTGTD